MKKIKHILLSFVLLACDEPIKTEDNTLKKEKGIIVKETIIERYNADQTDYKKDGMLVRLSSSNEPLSGIVFYNFSNGQLAYEREYINGLLHGRSVSYHENGQKSSEGSLQKDQLHGEVRAWDANGNLEYSRIYDKGNCVSGCN